MIEDIRFYPDMDHTQCEVCGISSFPHMHRAGTLPKDFDILAVSQFDHTKNDELFLQGVFVMNIPEDFADQPKFRWPNEVPPLHNAWAHIIQKRTHRILQKKLKEQKDYYEKIIAGLED